MSAERRVKVLKGILDEVGLRGERLEVHFLSSSEGGRFAQIATEMAERIKALGPSPLREKSVTSSQQSDPV